MSSNTGFPTRPVLIIDSYVQTNLSRRWGAHITKTCVFRYIENIENSPPKTESFQKRIMIFYHVPAQNTDCGYLLEPLRRGGSNEYPQSMFLSRNKKHNIYHCKPYFYHIKMGFKGVKLICFRYVAIL